MDIGITTDAGSLQTLHEVVAAARTRLDRNMWDYLVGGAGTETTLHRNRQALDRIGFRPRVLRDVSAIDAGAPFFGHRIRLPVCLAPVGGLDYMGDGGGVTVAQGAAAARVPIMLSSVSERSMEEVAAVAGPRVFQLYVRGDGAWVDDQVRRAIGAGYDAFCLTVDSALYSRRERDIANRFRKPWRAEATGMEYQAALNWDDVKRFKDIHAIPLILKGIATAEDADAACGLGVDVVYVSNHGGRQLDHGAGAIEVLPEVVAAVAGRARVMVDGGISRGADLVKAIALGADTVGIGRLYCYGFAAAGAAGVARVIDLLEIEVVECLGLLGLTGFAGLDASYVRAVDAVTPPHVHSAFPLLPDYASSSASRAAVAASSG
ncbi:MAG: alpha-hydroxy-acid oxidizing protein [Gemmatimonadaceae bacterium]|nr:alpha-hydroxy-acid oxidizing protein [Acetobacteraceae bacterium]